ncbi:MAG: FAD-dependent oxidoreductase, partial [Thermoplasmatota archaeon]
LPFWNRMLISIGIRDVNSINAYFGLTLVNVFFGKNYLLKGGIQQLVDKLSEKILFFGGKIILNANCKVLEKNGNKFRIKFEKQGVKKEKQFNKIISAVKPKDLTNICNFDNLRLLQKVDGHPMALYVIRSNRKLWSKTWGLIISEESSPIYALCDWKNINLITEDKLFLAICSPNASADEIINGLMSLFPKINSQYEIIFEKKWEIGLHQPNPDFFKTREEVLKKIPKDFYLAGDWMILPALEGAVLSGMKAARQLIEEL